MEKDRRGSMDMVGATDEIKGASEKPHLRPSFSVKLWPPSESTRKMLVVRITDNLTAKSIFTQKYGSLGKEEAEENARRIEDDAFDAANQKYEKEPDGDGGSAVHLYAKECSRLILEVLKRGAVKKEEAAAVFDISGGPRAFIEAAEEAEEILKPLADPANSFSRICLSNRSFGVVAASVAGPILQAMKSKLKDVDLSDFVAGRREEEALKVMEIFSDALEGSSLRSLNLSNNALGEKGIRAFGSLLRSQRSLEELYLMNDGISQEAARAISELLPATDNLRVLHFFNNMAGDEGAAFISEIVRRSPLLEDFRCCSMRIGPGGIALSEALRTCSRLKKLDLQDNLFGVEAGISLSTALSEHEALTEAYLSFLNLEDDGVSAVVRALEKSAPSLRVLDLAGNQVTAEATPVLATCIASKQCLAKLNLGENELGDGGAELVAEALQDGHDGLKEVDMNTNGIGRVGALALARAVVKKPGFKLLNLNGNRIPKDAIDDLHEIFQLFPTILCSVDDNNEEQDDADDDEEAEAQESMELKMKNLSVCEKNADSPC